VICALEPERRALAALAGPGVAIHRSGMGPDAAGACASAVLADRPRALLAVGFCGALERDLEVGDLVAAERVVHENTGAAFPADEVLLAAAPGRRGTLVSAVAVARTPADRAALTGLAVDLESATMARLAEEAGVPFLALRAVTDRARDRVPAIEHAVGPDGVPRPGAVLRHVARHPRDLRPLLRLGRAARRAGRSLESGLRTLLERIGA
jgi:adenosylhomocysteine nucleosidase